MYMYLLGDTSELSMLLHTPASDMSSSSVDATSGTCMLLHQRP